MPVGKNLFERLWEEMDILYGEWDLGNNIGEHPTWNDERKWELRGEMKGIAFAIKTFSHPHLQGDRDVSTLARRRWMASLEAGDATMIPTPGVDGCWPEPPPGVEVREVSAFNRKRAKPALSAADAEQVKKGLSLGFDAKELARMYKVDLAVIESLR